MDLINDTLAEMKEMSADPDQKTIIKQRIRKVKEQIVIYKEEVKVEEEKALAKVQKLESLKKAWVYSFFFV